MYKLKYQPVCILLIFHVNVSYFFQIQGVVCLQEVFLYNNTTHVCECTCVHWREWESCSKETLLALAAARCCLPASSSILEAARPHTDESQARTMAVWQLLCPGAAWKTATFSRRALRRRFWKARVQSLACLQSESQHPHHERLFQSPRRTWGETERNVISSKPFDAWWAEFLMWGLRINRVSPPPHFSCDAVLPLASESFIQSSFLSATFRFIARASHC